MKHTNKLVAALLAALVLAFALTACGDSGDGSGTEASGGSGAAPKSPEPGAPTIIVRNGEPVGGIKELEFSAGDQIRFNVKSDVAEEIHVHGYDLMQDVPKGGEVSFEFPAEIEGIFEVELEGQGEQIAELRVNP
jgi:hypothetical protein